MTEVEALHEQLRILWEHYERAAKPIIDRLVYLRSIEAPQPMYILLQEWMNLNEERKP